MALAFNWLLLLDRAGGTQCALKYFGGKPVVCLCWPADGDDNDESHNPTDDTICMAGPVDNYGHYYDCCAVNLGVRQYYISTPAYYIRFGFDRNQGHTSIHTHTHTLVLCVQRRASSRFIVDETYHNIIIMIIKPRVRVASKRAALWEHENSGGAAAFPIPAAGLSVRLCASRRHRTGGAARCLRDIYESSLSPRARKSRYCRPCASRAHRYQFRGAPL